MGHTTLHYRLANLNKYTKLYLRLFSYGIMFPLCTSGLMQPYFVENILSFHKYMAVHQIRIH